MAESKPLVVPVLLGMDERWSPPKGAAQATRVRDLWWDGRGGWSSSGGYRRIIRGPYVEQGQTYTNPFAGSGVIESIHFFSQHNGARSWLVYVDGSGNLYTFNPSTAARSGSPGDAAKDRDGTTLTRAVITTPWQRSQSACWGDNFYLINGIDRPLVFNGYWWDYAGFAGPAGAPSAVAMSHPRAADTTGPPYKMPNTGLGPTSEADTPGGDFKCAYRYRQSYVNSRGQESPLSEPSDLVSFTNEGGVVGARNGAHFAQVSLAIGGSEVVARRLYRTQNMNDSSGNTVTGRGDSFYFHSEIPDNVTGVIMDALPDGFLGSRVEPSALGPIPLTAKYLAPFKGCMFVTGVGNSSVYFSAPGQPEVFPLDNVIDVGDANLGPITAMYATRNALVIFKARGIYLIKGNAVDGFYAETLTRTSGCISQNTVKEVPNVGLVFLSDSSVNFLEGALENEGIPTRVMNLSEAMPESMRRMNRSALLNACAAVYHRDKEYWLCIPTIGYANPNLILVYHYEIREWSFRENFPVSSILETPDHRGHLLFGSYASGANSSPDGIAHLGIHVYSRGWDDKDGTAIAPLYETGQFSPGGWMRTFRPTHVMVEAILHGDNNLTVGVNTNRKLTAWLSSPQSQDQQRREDRSPLYGTATFDTSGTTWQKWRPGPQRFDLNIAPRTGPITEATVTFVPASRFMTLLGATLETAPDDPNSAKPTRGTA